MGLFRVKIVNKLIEFRDDFKDEFRKFKADNEGQEFILELTSLSSKKGDYTIYYKTDVLPRVAEIMNAALDKKEQKLSLSEVDFYLRMTFALKRSSHISKRINFDYAKEFKEMNRIEQLDFLSKVNIWVYSIFKVTLPKIKSNE